MIERSMRRKDRKLLLHEAQSLLLHGEYGVMATADEKGQPYGVPLSYCVFDEKIYVHCAKDGHKISNIRANNRVSFTVVGKVQALYDKNFTTNYESVIVFGKISEVFERDEKWNALYGLAEKYLPEHLDKAEGDIEASFERTAVYAISMEEISGKARKSREKV
ncbi:pyridoxamine 5'-phosphate oxidase family protein [Desulfococcaceae bacterium OttesenSCG-928-F15]|nr:pyridoxamine 5'-phosphate oxidase family protein [Desulfococcaceae bacterium OttesenSCG-928-F15]